MVYYKLTFLYAHYYLIIFYLIYIHLILKIEYTQPYTYTHTHTHPQLSSVQSLSWIRLFATLLSAAHQASLSITNSRSLPKLMSIVEKAVATHSSTLAWKIPWKEQPCWLQSMGSWRVGHNWATSLSIFTFIHWRRKWQPTPIFLPGGEEPGGLLSMGLYRVEHD